MAFPGAGILWQFDLPICPIRTAGRYAIRAAYACIFGMGCAARDVRRDLHRAPGRTGPSIRRAHHRRRVGRRPIPRRRAIIARRTVHRRPRVAQRRPHRGRDRYRTCIVGKAAQLAGVEHVGDIIARIAFPPARGRARGRELFPLGAPHRAFWPRRPRVLSRLPVVDAASVRLVAVSSGPALAARDACLLRPAHRVPVWSRCSAGAGLDRAGSSRSRSRRTGRRRRRRASVRRRGRARCARKTDRGRFARF